MPTVIQDKEVTVTVSRPRFPTGTQILTAPKLLRRLINYTDDISYPGLDTQSKYNGRSQLGQEPPKIGRGVLGI